MLFHISSYSGEYTVTYGKDTARYWFDNIKILGTTNSIEIKASGVVKVGYDMSKMVINVDNDSSKIYIKLPEIQLNDNYVIWDTVTCSESNNILNPIEFSQYEEIVDEIERMGLEDVESKGIYDKASENIKNIILSSNNLQELLCSPYKDIYYITKKSGNLKEYYTARINSKLRLIMKPEGEYPYNNLTIDKIEFVSIDDKHYGEG